MTITSYVMRLLPCDFNPAIQSMAFRVLQSVIVRNTDFKLGNFVQPFTSDRLCWSFFISETKAKHWSEMCQANFR